MPKVLVLNNYPLDEVWEAVKKGDKPDHHIYGLNYFRDFGYETEFVPFKNSNFLQSLTRSYEKLHPLINLGNLDRQVSALSKLSSADIIFAASQEESELLTYLKCVGLVRKPIVVMAHHPFDLGKLSRLRLPFQRLLFKNTNSIPSLSRSVSDWLNRISGNPKLSKPLALGPDKDFFQPSSSMGEVIFSAGRTGRDFSTLINAASLSGVPCEIFASQSCAPKSLEASKNIKVTIIPEGQEIAPRKLAKKMEAALAIAIPLHQTNVLVGLTGLVDALALGKPILMTRSPYIDLDIEAEGIGILLEPYDVNGWSEAIKWISKNPAEAKKMGKRSRTLVDAGLNSKTFAKQIVNIFDTVLGKVSHQT